MDPDLFTRARSKTHKGVAALPKQALEDGHFPDWEAIDGPLPEGPKPAVVFPVLVEPAEPAAPEPKTAGASSAKKKE
jgi:hypothetical protein